MEDKGISLRGTFVIDPEGKVRAATIHDLQVGRSVDETLRVLSAFETGELCPVGWTPGKKTLLITGCILAVALICFTRIYLGAHWTLDILAGTALGLLSVSFTALIFSVFIGDRRSLRARIDM